MRNYNFVIFYFLLSLLFSCDNNKESITSNDYNPGIQMLSLADSFTKTSPLQNYSTNPNIVLSLQNVKNANSILIYSDNTCSSLIEEITLSDNDPVINLALNEDGEYNFSYKLKKGSTMSLCSDSLFYSLDREQPVVTIDSLQNNSWIINSNLTNYSISGSCNKENQPITFSFQSDFSNFTHSAT